MGPTGVAAVEELALMVVTDNSIPIEHIYDVSLRGPHPRSAPLHQRTPLNLPMSRPLAAAVLSDARPSPVALYIIPPGADQDYTQALDTLVAESPSPA